MQIWFQQVQMHVKQCLRVQNATDCMYVDERYHK